MVNLYFYSFHLKTHLFQSVIKSLIKLFMRNKDEKVLKAALAERGKTNARAVFHENCFLRIYLELDAPVHDHLEHMKQDRCKKFQNKIDIKSFKTKVL